MTFSRITPTRGPFNPSWHRRALQRMRGRTRSAHGLKRWFVPGSEYMEGRDGTLTRYAAKERRRRRALGKIAKQARKVNR